MKFRPLLAIVLVLIIFSGNAFAQENENNKKTIVVLGSSVAAGWVTSYQEKYDMQNGYAYRLARLLEPEGYQVVNISIPGFDTKSTINRFNKDVLPLDPDYVLIGLSMSNEGLETMNPDSVFESYRTGIRKIIGLCEENDIKPVLGLCYSNDNYTDEQYRYLKKMNLLINSWEVPSVNLLGVLDDGHGHFPEGYTFDPNHPDDRGHEEMFYAFVPDMFKALDEGKVLPEFINMPEELFLLGPEKAYKQITYIPSEVMHSFTVSFSLQAPQNGNILEINTTGGIKRISLDNRGVIHYDGKATDIELNNNSIYNFTLTYHHLIGENKLYIDGKTLLEAKDQYEPLIFILGGGNQQMGISRLMIFRGALNIDEVNALHLGKAIDASLEVASLMFEDDFTPYGKELKNHALSNGHARVDADDMDKASAALQQKIEDAYIKRENELKVEHRKAIDVNPEKLLEYEGTYEIEPGDNLIVTKEDNMLFLDDHGRKAEILPYEEDNFFIHYPGDILILFERDETRNINGLTFSINGREMKAKKLQK